MFQYAVKSLNNPGRFVDKAPLANNMMTLHHVWNKSLPKIASCKTPFEEESKIEECITDIDATHHGAILISSTVFICHNTNHS